MILHFDEVEPAHRAEKLARLGRDAEFAQARAGIVKVTRRGNSASTLATFRIVTRKSESS